MKLQVVPLPEQRVGTATEVPWLLILSEAPYSIVSLGGEFFDRTGEDIGAAGVLVFEDEVEVVY